MHAALNDDVGVRFRGELGELQAVADVIGDAMVDLRRHVVMRKDGGVAHIFEIVDRLHIRGVERPFDGRDDSRHALVEMSGRGLNLGRPFQSGTGQGRKAAARANAKGVRRRLAPCARRASNVAGQECHRLAPRAYTQSEYK